MPQRTTAARYSIGTWDTDAQAYTPQLGAGPSINVTWKGLLRAMRKLRRLGYSAHRYRDSDGTHEHNDWSVLVERTDGMSRDEILKNWQR